jgi:membrane-bound ClpP family serine protease
MDLTKIGGLLAQLAPTVATALGGPLAGLAVKTLSEAMFGHQDGNESEVAAALMSATPEQLQKLKETDASFKLKMKELDIDLEKISALDRDSARKMQMETKDWLPKILTIIVTIGFFCILFWLLVRGAPPSGSETLIYMLGALGTAWTGVMQFYFGSSAGSKAKTDALTAKDLTK